MRTDRWSCCVRRIDGAAHPGRFPIAAARARAAALAPPPRRGAPRGSGQGGPYGMGGGMVQWYSARWTALGMVMVQ
eukprot:gene16668-biopygen6780